MMIPSELVVITNFVTITELDLRNTFAGLILPSVTSVFYIYLIKENFQSIPDELYLAAKVDGTSDFNYMMKVMVPICRPTIVTVTILKVIECWNSYVWPRLITDESAYYLVSNGIQELRENGFGRENIPAMMAAVVAISLPLVVLFLIFRKGARFGAVRVSDQYFMNVGFRFHRVVFSVFLRPVAEKLEINTAIIADSLAELDSRSKRITVYLLGADISVACVNGVKNFLCLCRAIFRAFAIRCIVSASD